MKEPELLRRMLNVLTEYNLRWDDEDGRELQHRIQSRVDEIDGNNHCCETCGKHVDTPCIECDECLQIGEYE